MLRLTVALERQRRYSHFAYSPLSFRSSTKTPPLLGFTLLLCKPSKLPLWLLHSRPERRPLRPLHWRWTLLSQRSPRYRSCPGSRVSRTLTLP
jgi:hypothetical protein